MKFKDWIFGKRKYVCLNLSKESNDNMIAYCMDNGLDLSVKWGGARQDPRDFKFHITVCHSTSRHDDSLDGVYKITPKEVLPKSFKVLGKDRKVLTLECQKTNIVEIKSHFEAIGFEDEWPDWIPHISLTYEHNFVIPKRYPTFPIYVDSLKVEDQD